MKPHKFLFWIGIILLFPLSSVFSPGSFVFHPATLLLLFLIIGFPALIFSFILFFTRKESDYNRRVSGAPLTLPMISIVFLFVLSNIPNLREDWHLITSIGVFLSIIASPISFIIGCITMWIGKRNA